MNQEVLEILLKLKAVFEGKGELEKFAELLNALERLLELKGAAAAQKELEKVAEELGITTKRTEEAQQKVREFQEAIEHARLSMTRLGRATLAARRGLELAGQAFTGLSTAAAAYVGAVAKATAQTVQWGREVYKFSLTAGLSAEEGSKLAAVAAEAGVSAYQFARAFGGLVDQISRIQRDLGKATKVFDEHGNVIGYTSERLARFGVVLTDAQGRARPIMDILAELSDIYKTLSSDADRVTFAQEAFWYYYQLMLPILDLGGEKIRELGQAYQRMGLILDEEALMAVVDFTRALNELKLSLTGLASTIGENVLPPLTTVVRFITALTVKTRESASPFAKLAATTGTAVASWIALIGVWRTGSNVLGWLVKGTTTLMTSLGFGGLAGAFTKVATAAGGFLLILGKIAVIVGAVLLAIKLLEKVLHRQILPWDLLTQKIHEFIASMGLAGEAARGAAEQVQAAQLPEAVKVGPPVYIPPGPPFPWEPLLRNMSASMVEAWSEAVGQIEERLTLYWREAGYEGEELASKVRQGMVEARMAVAEFLAGTRDAASSFIGQLAADVFRILRLRVEAIRAEEAAQAAEEQARALRRVLEEERRAFQAEQDAWQQRIWEARERVDLAREQVDKAKEAIDALKEAIDKEVEERLRLMGIILDPARMEELRDALEDARDQVEETRAALEDARARRRRYGLTLISWEEINAQAALEMAEAARRQAEAALREEQRKERIARRVRREVERQYAARMKALEEELELAEDRLKLEQKALRQLQHQYRQWKAAREAAWKEREAALLEEINAAEAAAEAARARANRLKELLSLEQSIYEAKLAADRERVEALEASREATQKMSDEFINQYQAATDKLRELMEQQLELPRGQISLLEEFLAKLEEGWEAWKKNIERLGEVWKALQIKLQEKMKEIFLKALDAVVDFTYGIIEPIYEAIKAAASWFGWTLPELPEKPRFWEEELARRLERPLEPGERRRYHQGGIIPQTGVYLLQKGEVVLTAPQFSALTRAMKVPAPLVALKSQPQFNINVQVQGIEQPVRAGISVPEQGLNYWQTFI